MNKRGICKVLFLVMILSLMMGMTVFAEEDDLTLISVSETVSDDTLVMASHGRAWIDGSMNSLQAFNNTTVELKFMVNSVGDPTDSFEILIYQGTQDSNKVMCSIVQNFSEDPGGSTYTYKWNTSDMNRYPAGNYTIVVTSYYYSDGAKTVQDTDSLEIHLEDYRLFLHRAFVERMYNKVFMRSADADGLVYYSEKLFNRTMSGAEVIIGFVNSPEFVNKHTSNREYLQVLYRAILDREAAESELEYWLEILDGGVSRNYVLKGFVDSPEFGGLCSSYSITQGTVTLNEVRDLNPRIADFVNRQYKLILEREDDGSGINYWVDILVRKAQTPQVVARGFVFSPEFINRNLSDEDFVRIMYRALMDREGEDAGVSYYLENMRNGLTREKVFSGFVNSPEFKKIVASYGL